MFVFFCAQEPGPLVKYAFVYPDWRTPVKLAWYVRDGRDVQREAAARGHEATSRRGGPAPTRGHPAAVAARNS